jgi:hypothetical protein
MSKAPTWLDRKTKLRIGLQLIADKLFQPVYQSVEKVVGTAKADELLAWAMSEKAKQENAEANPPKPPIEKPPATEPATIDAIDLSRVTQASKNRVDYNKAQVVNILRFADVDDKAHVRFNNDAPGSWWASSTDHMKFVRLQTFWPDGAGYYGGHIDWVRQGQTYKTLNNIPKNYLGKQPPKGSPMYFMLVSNDGKWRSNIVQSKRAW